MDVLHKGLVSIKDLVIGDMVRGANDNMARVYSFGHYHSGLKTEYLQIHAKGLSRPLEISKDHLVFVNGTVIPASLVSVGDNLIVSNEGLEAARVQKIKVVVRAGAYAPFTTSGTILVNGVATSNYVTLQADSPVLILGGGAYKTWFSMHWLAHVFSAPRRLWCRLSTQQCINETYTKDGIAKWVECPLQLCQWLVRQNGFSMAVILLPALLLALVLHAMEIALDSLLDGNVTTVAVLLAALFLMGLMCVKDPKRKQL